MDNGRISAAQIIQGGHATFFLRLINELTGDPFDLTTCTALSMCLKNTDGTELTLTLGAGLTVVTPATIGKIQVDVTSVQSALLNPSAPGTWFDLQLTVTLASSDPFKVQFWKAVQVIQTLC
jgi:hypothetical protein